MSDDDKPRPFDVPLVPDKGSEPFGLPVIDFGDVRVAHGLTRHPHRLCAHRSLVYSPKERRVWCETCERTIDGFDAFMTIVQRFTAMERAAEQRMREAKEAQEATLVRRAAKWLDRVWGQKMLPQCPRCGRGFTADEMLRCGQVGLEYELARRAKEKEKPP